MALGPFAWLRYLFRLLPVVGVFRRCVLWGVIPLSSARKRKGRKRRGGLSSGKRSTREYTKQGDVPVRKRAE